MQVMPLESWIVLIVGVGAVIMGTGAFFGAPYVPTKRGDLRRMFKHLYPLSAQDTLLDIGSGDGMVLREARHHHATVVGYEINPFFYGLSRLLSRGDRKTTIRLVNAWLTPFPDTVTVVYAFCVERDGPKLKRLMH